MNKLICTIILMIVCLSSRTQSIKILTSGTKTSLRGLSVVDENIVWVSGSGGMVGRSVNGGVDWEWNIVKGFEKTDFRDIEAFDANTAIIMGIESPARIFKTTDGGNSWRIMFEDTTKDMFLDAMEFYNENSAVVVGDPLNGKAFIAKFDNGKWKPIDISTRPPLDSGEAFFASSGTNIRQVTKYDMIAVTGGLQSNLLIDNKKLKLPLLQGKESTGANSIAVKNNTTFMIVGGDFLNKDSVIGNYCFTKDKGKTWIASIEPPTGYRSCVEYLGDSNWITCGLNGVDYTSDDGIHFRKISDEGFHVCRKAKKGNVVFLAGGQGKIGKLIL